MDSGLPLLTPTPRLPSSSLPIPIEPEEQFDPGDVLPQPQYPQPQPEQVLLASEPRRSSDETSPTPQIYATTDPETTNLDTLSTSPLPALKDILNPTPDVDAADTPPPRSTSSSPIMVKPGTPASGMDGSAPAKSPESRPLNVTDALSYLDAVKVQFQDKPDVYNHFLDIMKDFKSQVIDTPGVIERVSMLFHGNPYLIQGFNTFLPPGYRIEMSEDPREPNVITVTTPMGTTTQSTNTFGHHSRPARDPVPQLGTPGGPPFGGSGALPPLGGGGGTHSRSITPHSSQLSYPQAPFEGVPSPYSPGLPGASTKAAASFLGNLNNRNVEKQQAGEFHHAIQYLNKIKARYSDDPDKYKNFLEILQTYQKEQRGLNDSQVYVHVQGLFKDAPDLLSEFKDFLPNIVGPSPPGGVAGIVSQPPEGPGVAGPSWSQTDNTASKKPLPPLKRRKKPVEKDTTPVPPAKPSANRAKRAKHHHKGDSPAFSPYQGPHSPQNGHSHSHTHGHAAAQASFSHSHANQIAGSSSHGMGRTMTSPDELLFFDRAKKALESRDMYDDFLRLLNLFSKDIIDSKTLIQQAQIFLGDGDLFSQFKELTGWDERLHSVEHGPPGSIRTGPPENLSTDRIEEGQGMSYRRLPATEINLACSGRNELARSVLNDEWVSHPTWATEEAGFVAHKKNVNEDALHACEQERHEFDVFIQANARTIAVLEPIWERIQEMTNEEKAAFKLPPDLGGPTKSIYVRIIKRVYGGAHWEEVWDTLQKAPSVAVPVVLNRLKQKDEEWRREQRVWGRIWRGVEAKNYYKSLDHLGNNDYKNTEKKSITAKYLVADIETRRNEKISKRNRLDERRARLHKRPRRWFAKGSVGHELEYSFPDISVLHDSLKMVYSFLDHSQAQYSQPERRAVESFLRQFVPLLLVYPEAEFNAACGPLEPAHAEEMATDMNGMVDGSGVPAVDLRKKLLETAHDRSLESRAPSPSLDRQTPSDDVKTTAIDDVWIRETATNQPAGANGTSNLKKIPFFANSTYYTLLRLIQLLYSRLLLCKELGAKMTETKYAALAPNPIAVELGLDDPNGPTAFLAQLIEALSANGAKDETNVLYMYLLDAWEKVFDNELDQSTFEEHMRWFFGKHGYQVFTLDKIVTAIIKQVQGVLADQKSLDMRTLLENARSMDDASNRDIIRYRREAELNVGSDEHLYKVDWDRCSKTMRIQLLGSDDPSMEERASGEDRWREYVDSYIMSHPTEWMPAQTEDTSRNTLFLRRSMAGEESPLAEVHNDIAIRISLGTYKLFYEAGTEDVLWRKEDFRLNERAKVRHEERKRSSWLL